MKLPILVLIAATSALAQRNAIDWPFVGNDAQRTGWEKSDSSITKDNVKDFQLVMKMSLDPKVKGTHSISPPVVLGRLISYKGFKELAFVESANDTMWAIDADTNRIFWEKHFDKPQSSARDSGPNAAACAGAVASMPSLMPPPAFGGRGGARPPAPAGATGSLLSAGGFGGPRPAFAISGDGKLHLMNTSTGEDVTPAMQFLPSGSKATSLVVSENVVYTTSIGGCGGTPAGVWALDLSGEGFKVTSFHADVHGIAFGNDGKIFAQTTDSLTALKPKELKAADSFKAPAGMANAAPVIFTWKERELVVAAGKAGQLYVFDAKSLATPLSETTVAGPMWGGLSSWAATDGTRWILAPIWGAGHGKIAAYRLEDSNGAPTLTQAWVSGELSSPEPPVITSGIVFALSAGNYANEHAKPSGHAKLFAFDGTTGKELYNTGDQVTSPANLTGITLANGRLFFTTTDGTLYGFGIFLER